MKIKFNFKLFDSKFKINFGKYDKPIKAGIAVFVILLIGLIIYIHSMKNPNFNKILLKNYGQDAVYFPSEQSFRAEISNSQIEVKFNLQNIRDKDTDHLFVTGISPQKDYEMYVDKMDRKYGVYTKFANWRMSYKPMTVSEDNPRTIYVESNNEKSIKNISASMFTEGKMKRQNIKDDDLDGTFYVMEGKTTYLTAMFLLGNVRYAIYENYNYEVYKDFFSGIDDKLIVNIKMYFSKKNHLIKKIEVTQDNDSLKEYMNNTSSQLIPTEFTYTLVNTGWDEEDVYVPIEIDKAAIKENTK